MGGVELTSATIVDGETATVTPLKGTSVSGAEIASLAGATFKSSDETVALVNANGKVTTVQPGKVTITIKIGEVTKDVALTVASEERKVAAVTADKTSIGTVTGATPTIKLTVKDQYGDLYQGANLTAETVLNADKKAVLTVGPISATDTKGEVTVTVTGDSTNTGKGTLVFKDGENTVLSVPVTVGSSDKVAKRGIELDSSSKSTDNAIDKIDEEDNSLTLVYNKYAEGDLLIGPETLGGDYTVKTASGKEEVVSISVDGNKIVATAVKAGEETIQILEGGLVRATYKVVVSDSTPSIESVTFEKDPAITALETDLSTVLKAANIKLTSTDAVEINSAGKIVLAGKEVVVGSIDFVSTVGAATVAEGANESLVISIENESEEDIEGTVTLRVKDTSDKVIATKAITVEIVQGAVAPDLAALEAANALVVATTEEKEQAIIDAGDDEEAVAAANALVTEEEKEAAIKAAEENLSAAIEA